MEATFKPMLNRARMRVALNAVKVIGGVAPNEILSRSRQDRICQFRQAVWLALRVACDAPMYKLGKYFERDHTTVMYGVERAAERAKRDAEYAAIIELIAAEVRAA